VQQRVLSPNQLDVPQLLLPDGQGPSKSSGVVSLIVHGLAIITLLSLGGKVAPRLTPARNSPLYIPLDLQDAMNLVLPQHGSGGGGDHSLTAASLGKLAPFAPLQLAPPEAVNRAVEAKLEVDATLLGPPDIKLPSPDMNVWGDPHGVSGPPSNGTGSGSGIGSGCCGGVGSGNGRGTGPGSGDSGFENPSIHVVTGATQPIVIYSVDPEFTDEARKAKYQGTVEISIIVDADGRVRDPRVLRAVGLGLDERAIEAVSKWKFKPATKDGRAVPVAAQIHVTFRLL